MIVGLKQFFDKRKRSAAIL